MPSWCAWATRWCWPPPAPRRSRRPGIDFLPLTVDYRENNYAGGKIPGGFFKREGRPNEKEILTSRMIDRPLRPLFPEGYACETQVIGLLLSADLENDSDTLAIIGASTALYISDIPFDSPVGAVRVGYWDGQCVVNPVDRRPHGPRASSTCWWPAPRTRS